MYLVSVLTHIGHFFNIFFCYKVHIFYTFLHIFLNSPKLLLQTVLLSSKSIIYRLILFYDFGYYDRFSF